MTHRRRWLLGVATLAVLLIAPAMCRQEAPPPDPPVTTVEAARWPLEPTEGAEPAPTPSAEASDTLRSDVRSMVGGLAHHCDVKTQAYCAGPMCVQLIDAPTSPWLMLWERPSQRWALLHFGILGIPDTRSPCGQAAVRQESFLDRSGRTMGATSIHSSTHPRRLTCAVYIEGPLSESQVTRWCNEAMRRTHGPATHFDGRPVTITHGG